MIPKYVSVEQLEKMTVNDLDKIVTHYQNPFTIVRYIKDDETFGTAGYGWFVIIAHALYVLDDKDWHCDGDMYRLGQEIPFQKIQEYLDTMHSIGKHLMKVNYAGQLTPLKDVRGENIFTGDIVDAYLHKGSDEHYIGGVAWDYDRFSLLFENYPYPMDDAFFFEKIGTAFFCEEKASEADFVWIKDNYGFAYDGDYADIEVVRRSTLTPHFWKGDAEEKVLWGLGVYEPRNRVTPERIYTLLPDEVFVFGSNIQGHHKGGAARLARERFRAVYGQGVGMQGRAYAIPTMFGSLEEIQPYVHDFIDYAIEHKDRYFYVTEIGCGIAGWTPEEIAPMFARAISEPNIMLPKAFWDILGIKS